MPPKKQKGKILESAGPSTSDGQNEDTEQSAQDVAEQFERELYWCIDQLQLGLEKQNPDSRKAQEAVRLLKILTSTKSPMIKKRQVMRNTFGDYRKKMEEEEKKSTAIAKKIKLSSVQSDQQTGKFFRKGSKVSRSTAPEHKSTVVTDYNTDISTAFKFNFSINEDMKTESIGACGENVKNVKPSICDGENVKRTCVDSVKCENGISSDSTPFKFTKSDNDFKFSFSVPDVT